MLVPEEEAVSSVDIILAAECPLWPWDKESDIPLKKKKLAFDKVMLLHRLREEDGILLKEMKQHWQSLCRYSRRLKEDITSDLLEDCLPPGHTPEACEGLRCILKAQLDGTKRLMTEVQSVYKNIVVTGNVLHQEEEDEDEEESFEGVMDSTDDSETDEI